MLLVYNNEIGGNEISNYSLGIITNSNDINVHDNKISNCEIGIQLSSTKNSKINNNIIRVTQKGISATNTSCEGIEIKGNEIFSDKFLMYFVQFNNKPEDLDNVVIVSDNIIDNNLKKVTINNVNGLYFSKNVINGGLEIGNTTNSVFSENIIKPTDFDGIRLYENHSNVSILNNTIYDPTGAERFLCINNKSNNPNSITIDGNTCN